MNAETVMNPDNGRKSDPAADSGWKAGKVCTRFPFFVDIHGWNILVIGGGTIASRRIRVLSGFGPEITVMCPRGSDEIRSMADEGRIELRNREFTEDILFEKRWNLVLAATDDSDLNTRVCRLGREQHIPVNNASDQTDCDFFFPAIVQGQGMIIGMVSDGTDHHKVRRIAARIREEYGDKDNE